MRILVLHGSSANFGDTAMLEGVVLNLLRNLPSAELFVADRPGLRTTLWRLPRVHRQTIPSLVFPGENVLTNARYLWRYDERWRATIHKSLPFLMGRAVSASRIGLRGMAQTTLLDFCAQFHALHLVGGGYLTDTFPELLLEVFCFAQSFRQQGKPILVTGQQVGPFRSRILRAHTRRLLHSARFVGLREPTGSVHLCRQFGLEPRRFRVMGDDSFGLPPSNQAEVRAHLRKSGLEPGRFLAFNVRVGPYAAGHAEHLGFIAQVAEELSTTFCLPVALVPIAFNEADSDDRSGAGLIRLIQRAQVRRLHSRDLTPALVRGILGKAFGAIGVSYHFCTFALSQGIPAVSLHEGDYYSQKARGICGFWRDGRLAVSLQKPDVSSTVAHIAEVLRDRRWRQKLAPQAHSAIQGWQEIFDEQVRDNFAA